MKTLTKYIVDTSKLFTGNCQTVVNYIVNEDHSLTEIGVVYQIPAMMWEEYQEKNSNMILVNYDELNRNYLEPYYNEISNKPYKEISVDDYIENLHCLLPNRWFNVKDIEVWYCPESTQGYIHVMYLRQGNKCYVALRKITMSYSDILNDIRKHCLEFVLD